MSGKPVRTVMDFPDGLIFVGPEDPLCNKRKIKEINIKEALKYSREARKNGRTVTQEEMQQFVVYYD